jgi:hypothetical protein
VAIVDKIIQAKFPYYSQILYLIPLKGSNNPKHIISLSTTYIPVFVLVKIIVKANAQLNLSLIKTSK